ncbi:HepT-like ribonuclease domain-containing protein [Microbacterium sp. 22242]|uniref:HepT-like ribonuclease domain-containing protein n=1 Tax=Microbacterium sp. 22242 TaxID=3453896 RepID=UPI003F841AC7
MRPESSAFLWDAGEAARRVSEFITDLDEDTYRQDALHRSAVERQLEIVGEALGNLRKHDPETAAAIPDLHRIVGLRNVLAHGYAVVDDGVVWTAARHRIPELIVQINALLGETQDS